MGGLIVAVLLKYADNLVKCFATGFSLVLTCVMSSLLPDELQLDITFIMGSLVVVGSTMLYNLDHAYLAPLLGSRDIAISPVRPQHRAEACLVNTETASPKSPGSRNRRTNSGGSTGKHQA